MPQLALHPWPSSTPQKSSGGIMGLCIRCIGVPYAIAVMYKEINASVTKTVDTPN